MPLQNRVTPTGEIVVDGSRGLMMGNRGCLHGPGRQLGVTRWRSRLWICCVLDWKGVRRDPMPPGRWTALFFLDEATALAAGHRPCAECRNADYRGFLALTGASSADELDETLHAERGRLHEAELDQLPDGAFVLLDGEPWLVVGSELLRWTPGGYSERRPRFSGPADIVTPPTTLHVLASGWRGDVPFVNNPQA